ncbi:hypothetical protein GGS26DRAFT_590616 [Hypomontagnella submonticulosa]|nr:hypothetical protein GGS26DRAFT_590616 [Hypomontagnella submonticulosa]
MPEPFATFTAVLGILNIIRTAFGSLHADTVEWRNYPGWTENNRRLLRSHEESFFEWQRRWMVWIRNDDILAVFWGPRRDKITEELERIKDVFKTLAKLLSRVNLDGKGRIRKHVSRFWNTFLIRRTDEIEKALGKLGRQITLLNEESNHAFFRHPQRNRLYSWETVPPGPPDNARIHQLGLSILLVRLALNTNNESDQLHRCALRDDRTLSMELELNHFGSDLKDIDRCPRKIEEPDLRFISSESAGRPGAVARSDADNALHYTFLVKELAAQGNQLWLRIRATPDPDVVSPCFTFLDAVRRIRNHRSSPCGLALSNNEANVWVRHEIGYITGEIKPEPLREALMTIPTRDDLEFPMIKAHRALQIAEFGLLFFKTTWIRSLCSCTVHEMRVTPNNELYKDEAMCRLTLKRLTQDAPSVPGNPVDGCWCRFKTAAGTADDAIRSLFERFPLFSLGLLLIEVALSRPIEDIQIQGQIAHENEIRLRYSGWAPQGAAALPTLKQLENEVNMNTDPDSPLYPAIKFCIQRRITVETVSKDDLTDYFWDVINPIVKNYNYHVELRRKRQ